MDPSREPRCNHHQRNSSDYTRCLSSHRGARRRLGRVSPFCWTHLAALHVLSRPGSRWRFLRGRSQGQRIIATGNVVSWWPDELFPAALVCVYDVETPCCLKSSFSSSKSLTKEKAQVRPRLLKSRRDDFKSSLA